jgi:hypothetical protein
MSKTRTLRYFNSWLKQRGDIFISYNPTFWGGKAKKIYYKMTNGELIKLKEKVLN